VSQGAATAALRPAHGDTPLAVGATVTGPATGCVRFELAVRNGTGRRVSVSNPYLWLTYTLVRADGRPVQVGAPTSQDKVDVALDPRRRLEYLGVESATLAAAPLDDVVTAESFDLDAGAGLVLALHVARSIDPDDRSTLDHVPAGEYHMPVRLRLDVTDRGETQSVRLRTEHDLTVTVC
jgi:hypothetical protein